MSEIKDFDALREAMALNSEQPEGPARNARAEQLLAEAEKLNIPLAVIEALGHQLKAYNYSSEKDRMSTLRRPASSIIAQAPRTLGRQSSWLTGPVCAAPKVIMRGIQTSDAAKRLARRSSRRPKSRSPSRCARHGP